MIKKTLPSASGWIVATFSLLALFLAGVTYSPSEAKDSISSELSMDPFIGEIAMFAGNFAPRGWALCNGQLLPIAQNQALFSILGTTYGGDGRTTFGLPDLRGRVAVHAGNGPGLSSYPLGRKGGSESVSLSTGVPVALDKTSKTKGLTTGSFGSNMQPYTTINYIIALQGVFPSRN